VRAALERHATSALQGDSGFAFRDRGDAARALAHAPRTVQAAYHAPYLAHAAMEPMNCTAQVLPGLVRLWAPTQVPSFARAAAAHAAGVAESAVELTVTPLGGGFGRRLEVDFIAQAVQLLWPREEDFTHDFYRPAAAAVLHAALDEAGQPTALAVGSASDAVLPRYCERCYPLFATPLELPDKTTAEGLFDLPYAIPHLRVRHHATHSGVPVGSWRSVGHSHNAFFAESFIDELAHAANADPVAYRLALLEAAAAGWGQPLPAGQAQGVALHESFGTIVAMVVQASLDTAQRPRVHRVVVAVDCGTVVHPGIVAQQVEGSVVFGLTAALFGRIDIRNSIVQQRNFPDQPLLTMAQTPAIETHILPSTRDPSGMGEPAVPPVAPALANALFRLTGQRLRELPLIG
jgi:isoquinoline 1-oxidoreductase beta subunit